MSTFKYTITKFDEENKIVVVTFDDGSWAELRLTNPLPKDIESLEEQIKRFTSPKEAIEARTNPDADLSYVSSLVGIEKECSRFEISPKQNIQDIQDTQKIDPEVESNLAMWEEINFQKKVGEALVALGVTQTNPATIPVAS